MNGRSIIVRLVSGLGVLMIALVVRQFTAWQGPDDRGRKLIQGQEQIVEVKAPNSWEVDLEINPDANLQILNERDELYLIVFSEPKTDFEEDLTYETFAEIAQQDNVSRFGGEIVGAPIYITVGGRPAIQSEIRGSFEGVKLVMLHVTVDGEDYFHQILSWTLPSRWEQNRPVLTSVIQSFKEIGAPELYSVNPDITIPPTPQKTSDPHLTSTPVASPQATATPTPAPTPTPTPEATPAPSTPDPTQVLQTELEQAVQAKDYTQAITIVDQLITLQPQREGDLIAYRAQLYQAKCAAGISLATLPQLQNQSNLLYLCSVPGDFIGEGKETVLTPAEGNFSAKVDGSGDTQIEFAGGPNQSWDTIFTAPNQARLELGQYDNAARHPFQSPTQPGLSFSGSGRGCSKLTGNFTILDIQYDSEGQIQRMDATFKQVCEASSAPLYGRVRYAR